MTGASKLAQLFKDKVWPGIQKGFSLAKNNPKVTLGVVGVSALCILGFLVEKKLMKNQKHHKSNNFY